MAYFMIKAEKLHPVFSYRSVSNTITKNVRILYKWALEMFDKMGGVAEDISDAEMSNG